MQIYELLKDDHDKVRLLLNELITLPEDHERCDELIEQIRDELVPHSRAEESVFYNSLRTLDESKKLAMHGFQEHLQAESLLRTLQVKDKLGGDWKKTANKLKDALDQHIHEEETDMFAMARRLFTEQEAEMMADAFQKLKPKAKEQGFMKNTLDMIANLMPPRFSKSVGLSDDSARIQ